MKDIVERIATRINDSPMPIEHLLDECEEEIVRLRGKVSALSGPLAELIIAYQDADSPAIQDTLRRGRLALTSNKPGGE